MEEDILREMLAELKGLRQGQAETNQRLGTTVERIESLERTTNERFASMDKRFEGLASSVQVLTQGFNEVRYELVEIKKMLATRVIWNNDSIILQVRDGKPLYGTIRKDEKKGE